MSALVTMSVADSGPRTDMSRVWWLARRAVFAVVAAFLVLSVAFSFIALTPDPQLGLLQHNANLEASQKRIPVEQTNTWDRLQRYKKQHNLDEPFLERYKNILISYTTLDWGNSYGASGTASDYGVVYAGSVPVMELLGRALKNTLRYVVPAVVFAVLAGLGMGLYAATHQRSLFDRLATSLAHLGFSFPNFWLGTVALLALGTGGWLGLRNGGQLFRTTVLPAAVVWTTLVAGQLRYTRVQALEYIDTDFIKLVRAKGAKNGRVARHLLRNAAIPLLSLFFSDLLGILIVEIFVVEYVFGIPGLGSLGLVAIISRDLPVVLGVTMTIVLVGVVGNFLQDVAYGVFDPRVETN